MENYTINKNQIQGILQILEGSDVRAFQFRDIRNLLISLPMQEEIKDPLKKASKDLKK